MKTGKNKESDTTRDMTIGPLLPIIIKFTIPLVLGNFLQLTYNAVDAIIVGKCVGEDALAAVGTSNPIMSLIILFVQGICIGAGVLIGTLYGAKKLETLKRQISTAMLSGLVFSVIVSAISFVLAPVILRLLQVDQEIMDISVTYLRIIMLGLVFNFIYNFFASTLRAMGDSKSPLIFLGISAVINIIGDLIFVLAFSMGVAGCGISTVISEAISCLLCWMYIKNKVPILNLGRKWFVFDRGLLKQTLQYGFVTAMQQSTVQLGKLGIQTIVNTMGVVGTAAFAAVNRVDDYALIPQHNISHAMMSVMAQNRGAKKMSRVREAFKVGLLIELIYGAIIGVIMFVFARPIMLLFASDEAVVSIGVKYMCLISFMYIIPAFTNAVQGFFRGMGDLKITLVSSMLNMGARVLSCIPMVFLWDMGFEALPWSYFVGWAVMMAYELPFLVKTLRNSKSM